MQNSQRYMVPGDQVALERERSKPRGRASRWALLALAALAVAVALVACGGGGVPGAPSEVTVTPVAGGLRVDWTAGGGDATGFKVYRETLEKADPEALEPQALAEVASVPGDARRYYDFAVEETASYVYGVSAVGAGGESAVTMQSDPEPVTPLPGVEVTIDIVGTGSVTASGGGEVFECTASCVAAFAHGTEVTLEATGSGEHAFATWLEDCGGAGVCAFTLDEPRHVVAAFSSNVLRLTLDGDSPVSVAVSPGHGGQGSAVCELMPGGSCGFGYPAPVGVSVNVTLAESGGQFTGFGSVCSAPQGRYCVVNSPGGLTELSIGAIRPPVAGGDSYGLLEDVPFSIDAEGGVLANDVDSPWDTLTAVLVTDVTHGELTLEPNGGFSYSAPLDFNGSDSFTYFARDAYGNESETVTVALTIAPVNDAPTFSIPADPPTYQDGLRPLVTIPGFATSISPGGGPDEAGQVLSFGLERVGSAGPNFLQQPAISPSGTLTYQHAPGTYGTARFRVVLTDNGGTANGGQNASEPRFFEITATPLLLTVAVGGTGSGTVNPPHGTHERGYGASVTVSATADSGSRLTAWGGACSDVSVISGSCTFTMVQNTSVSVTFTALRRLSVELAGSGVATVSGSPHDPGCAGPPWSAPRTCAGVDVLHGQTVTLTAVPFSGSFLGWEGACSGTGTTCQVLMDADKNVIARFSSSPSP